jgi:hypothetical protein
MKVPYYTSCFFHIPKAFTKPAVLKRAASHLLSKTPWFTGFKAESPLLFSGYDGPAPMRVKP